MKNNNLLDSYKTEEFIAFKIKASTDNAILNFYGQLQKESDKPLKFIELCREVDDDGFINIWVAQSNQTELYGIICYFDENYVRFDKYLLTKATFDKLSKAELVCRILSMQNE